MVGARERRRSPERARTPHRTEPATKRTGAGRQTGRAGVRASLRRTAGYERQRALVRPSPLPLPGAGGSPELVEARAEARDEVLAWAGRASDAMIILRDRARGAVERFVGFLEKTGAGAVTKAASGLTSLFGALGAIGSLPCYLLTLLADATAGVVRDGETSLALFVQSLDGEQERALRRIEGLQKTWLAWIDRAGSDAELSEVLDAVRAVGVERLPSENELYGEMLLAQARSEQMDIEGDDYNESWGYGWYGCQEVNWGMGRGSRCHAAAKELDGLARAEPRLKRWVRTRRDR